jgi:exopolyphosphatase/guanosine-5'-triphosphate,3'-diphosphate pyrophosphatase
MDDVFKGISEDPIDPAILNGLRAAIDVGTNTVLLLVAKVEDGKINVIDELDRMPRLGKGVDGTGNLDYDSMIRTITVLIEYRDYIVEKYGVIPVLLTGTSAVRDAKNRIEFLRLIEESTGYRLRILSPTEEAVVTYKGALSMMFLGSKNVEPDSHHEYVVIDIGGGSTEIAIGKKYSDPHTYFSMDMGSVRFTERFLGDCPPQLESTDLLQVEIRRQLQNVAVDQYTVGPIIGIGVAGTAMVIWRLINKLENIDSSSFRAKISLIEIDHLIEQLRVMNIHQILELNPDLLRGRSDIILAGSYILQAVMKAMRLKEIQVSSGGVRHGSLLTYLY